MHGKRLEGRRTAPTHTRARAGEQAGTGAGERGERLEAIGPEGRRTHGRRDSERSEQAREQAGTLYVDVTWYVYTIYSVK